MTSSDTKPTIILVPGAWHLGTIHYKRLVEDLEKAGYEVNALDLPTICDNPAPSLWKEDVPYIARAIEEAVDQGKDVVLVMHSRGGLVGSDACEGLSKVDRQARGKPGGLVRLVFVCAFAAHLGQSIWMATDGPDPWLKVGSRLCWPEDIKEIFYNDCSEEDIAFAQKHLTRMPTACFAHGSTYEAWKHIPSTYLQCEKDNAIPIFGQEAMCSQPGAKFDIERCGASHSPFLSMPDFTAEVIRRAAGEKI